MVTSEYPASAALAQDWIEAWNTRDLDRLLSHYHPEIVRHNFFVLSQ